MNGFLLFVSLILLSDLFERIYGQNENNCQDLSQCVNKLRDLTNDENMAFAYNQQHLEELCGKLKVAVDCVNTFIKKCLDYSSQIQYEAMTNGTQKLIRDLCVDSPFRREYLKHAKCYHKHQSEFRYCSEKYFTDFNRFKEEEPSIQIQLWCCNFDGHRQCIFGSVLQHCGNEAAHLAKEIVTTGGGLLVYHHCGTNYTWNSPRCSSGLSHHSFTHWSHVSLLMILSFVIILSNVWT